MDDNKFHAMITVKFQGGEINGYQISDQKDLKCFIDNRNNNHHVEYGFLSFKLDLVEFCTFFVYQGLKDSKSFIHIDPQ